MVVTLTIYAVILKFLVYRKKRNFRIPFSAKKNIFKIRLIKIKKTADFHLQEKYKFLNYCVLKFFDFLWNLHF